MLWGVASVLAAVTIVVTFLLLSYGTEYSSGSNYGVSSNG